MRRRCILAKVSFKLCFLLDAILTAVERMFQAEETVRMTGSRIRTWAGTVARPLRADHSVTEGSQKMDMQDLTDRPKPSVFYLTCNRARIASMGWRDVRLESKCLRHGPAEEWALHTNCGSGTRQWADVGGHSVLVPRMGLRGNGSF